MKGEAETGCCVQNTSLCKLKRGAHSLTEGAISKHTPVWGLLLATLPQGSGGSRSHPRTLMGANGQAGFFL